MSATNSCELRVLRPPVCMLDGSTRLDARWFSTGAVGTPAECTRRMRRVNALCSSQGDSARGRHGGGALVQVRFRRHLNLTATVDMRPARTLNDDKIVIKLYRSYFVAIHPALAHAHGELLSVSRMTSLHKPSSVT